ncbi:F-box domain [Arabidopsis thaliana x Arabidopsis arenosa]|uniref:F-box domain n=1 Tax=Arabidopsis thaliana x Arabidopsis arenosa TaxID=1240361 RepID=A0A8T1ZKA2_9BRAS|nr:F-box domain [Arabidopsis thaliana x Arabidopsis arenosa]
MKRCKSCGQGLSNEDRISQLPESLLLQILSLLPTTEVVAMSVLAKRWRYLWKMVPNLEFIDYGKYDLETFSNIVCRCLLSHQAPFLQRLHLEMSFDSGSSIDIGLLLGIAFGRQLRELVLESYSGKSFRFPTSLYYCETLETLELYHCILIHVPFPVCLKSLRTLHLHVMEYKDDESVVNLFSGCISLENLVVHQSTEFSLKTFTIAVPSLQRLTLMADNECEENSVYVINAPSLKYLKIEGILEDGSCLIENNTPELVEASIIGVSRVVFESILGSLYLVKRLSLKIGSPLEIKFPTGSIFHHLIYLEIHTNEPEWWNLLMLMLDTSPKLQVLKLIGDWFSKGHRGAYRRWNQPKHVPEGLLLCLVTLVWTYYEGLIKDEKEVAKYILRNASRLKKATFSNKYSLSEEKLERLKELENVVMASNSCQLVFESI